MKKIIKYQNAELIYFTDKGNIQSLLVMLTPLNITENVLVIDMDSDYKNIKKEVSQYDVSNIICISSNWSIKKFLDAMNYNCRAFLEADTLDSLNNTIELIQNYKTSVFDNIPLSILNSLLNI